MTAVIFKFQQPDGDPVANAPFVVTVRKPSFDETTNAGILLPGDVTGLTDAQGECTLELPPGNALYYLIMDLPQAEESTDGCMSGLRYKFLVPDSVVPVKVETLIVSTPTWSRPWDEAALAIIIDAKAASTAAATAAEDSAVRAKASEDTVASDAQDARDAAAQAAEDAVLAAHAAELAQTAINSAEQAVEAAAQAKLSETASGLSETASAMHAEHAQASEEAATSASTIASEQAGIAVSATQAATLSAERAEASESAAGLSATAAKNSEDSAAADALTASQAKAEVATNAGIASNAATVATAAADAAIQAEETSTQNATQTGLDRTAVTAAANLVEASAEEVALNAANTAQNAAEAKTARDQAVDAAASIAGALVEMGGIDLSSNAYPPKPAVAGIWKVTVGGVVSGVDYGIGDSLVYSKTLDQFYKIDNTEAVSSVNGKTGVVVLAKADVGLPLADNTPDTAKPVSVAQQAALDAKIDKTSLQSTDNLVEGANNKYWTNARTLASLLTGFTLPTVAAAQVTSADSVLTALAKLQWAITGWMAPSIANLSAPAQSGPSWTTSGTTNPIAGFPAGSQSYVIPSSAATEFTQLLFSRSNPVRAGVRRMTAGALTQFTELVTYPSGTTVMDVANLPTFQGATAVAAGVAGMVPAPAIKGAKPKYLCDDGIWREVEAGGTGMSVGMTYAWTVSRATIPAGSLPKDGQLVDRATWPDLWALYSTVAVDDSVWLAAPYTSRGLPSKGNGTTTFRMPDTNGKHADGNTIAAMVLRGDGKNSAGTPGLHQADQLQNITGTFSGSTNATRFNPAAFAGAFQGTGLANADSGSAAATNQASQVSFDASRIARAGTETRSANETVIWCVHGAAAAVNPGSVDVTALASTVNNQNAQIAALDAIKVKRWTSANVSITAAPVVINHTLGTIPDLIHVKMTLTTAQGGWPVGTTFKIPVSNGSYGGSAAASYGVQAANITSTSFSLNIGNGGIIIVNTGGTTLGVTPANFTSQIELLAWS